MSERNTHIQLHVSMCLCIVVRQRSDEQFFDRCVFVEKYDKRLKTEANNKYKTYIVKQNTFFLYLFCETHYFYYSILRRHFLMIFCFFVGFFKYFVSIPIQLHENSKQIGEFLKDTFSSSF